MQWAAAALQSRRDSCLSSILRRHQLSSLHNSRESALCLGLHRKTDSHLFVSPDVTRSLCQYRRAVPHALAN